VLKIGVIGCGTIGAQICQAIDAGVVRADLIGVCDPDRAKIDALAERLRHTVPVLCQTEAIRAADLVVEAVSRAAAPAIIREALLARTDVVVMSVGGLIEWAEEAVELAEQSGARIYVPTGAIAGLDAVKGALIGGISHVTLTTRKPPQGLAGAPYFSEHPVDLAALTQATVIFSGSAGDAIPAFPANVNVAAALSLAGIGPDRTAVRIVADPASDRNVHEIEVEGAFGRLFVRMENVPSPQNPKTSHMAALSAIALLRRLTASLVVGT
jgi:aspartate dehydrogenase